MNFIVLPIALGLLGFIEPCSIGASVLFLKSVVGLLFIALGAWSIYFGVVARWAWIVG